MTATVLKTFCKKQSSKLICQKYKNSNNYLFREKFITKDLLPNDKRLKGFQDFCIQILNSLAPFEDKMKCLS